MTEDGGRYVPSSKRNPYFYIIIAGPQSISLLNHGGADCFAVHLSTLSCVSVRRKYSYFVNALCIYNFLLAFQVPVRVAGGLLFELLGQSVGDPNHEEEDIPIVLRSWQAQNFLVTAMHVKGPSSNINVLGVTEVQVPTRNF